MKYLLWLMLIPGVLWGQPKSKFATDTLKAGIVRADSVYSPKWGGLPASATSGTDSTARVWASPQKTLYVSPSFAGKTDASHYSTYAAARAAATRGDVIIKYSGLADGDVTASDSIFVIEQDTSRVTFYGGFGNIGTMTGGETPGAPTRPVFNPFYWTVVPTQAAVVAHSAYHGFDFSMTSNSDSINTNTDFYPYESTAKYYGAGSIGQLNGGLFFTDLGAAGIASNASRSVGIRILHRNAGTGTDTTNYGLYVDSPLISGGGSILTNYGILIKNQSTAGIVKSYSIYSESGENWFGGNMAVVGPLYTFNNLWAINKAGSSYVNLLGRDTTGSDVRFTLGDVKSIGGANLSLAGKLRVNGYVPIDSAFSVEGGAIITGELNVSGASTGVGLRVRNGLAIARGASGGTNYIDSDTLKIRSSSAGAGLVSFYGNTSTNDTTATRVTNTSSGIIVGGGLIVTKVDTAGSGVAITINGSTYNTSDGPSGSGITSLNGLEGTSQTFAVGTDSSDFKIASSGTAHTFNLPTASATKRGALSSEDWSTFNGKTDSSNVLGMIADTAAQLRTEMGAGGIDSARVKVLISDSISANASKYLKNADSTTQRTYSNSLYLKNADSASQRNYSNSLYLKNADSTSERNYSNSLYLKNADSTSQRNYSNYLRGQDTTRLKVIIADTAAAIRSAITAGGLDTAAVNGLIATMLTDSTQYADTSGLGAILALGHTPGLKANATKDTVFVFDATIEGRNDSTYTDGRYLGLHATADSAIYVRNGGTDSVRAALVADSLRGKTFRPMASDLSATGTGSKLYLGADDSIHSAAATITRIFYSGLIDSTKTSDTLSLGRIMPGWTLDTLYYDCPSSVSMLARVEMVDSLYGTVVTLIDSTTITGAAVKQSGASLQSTTLTAGKLLRMVFPTVGTMPKHWSITAVGHQ